MSRPLLKRPLNKDLPIAFVCSPRLGDTLIGFVTLNNLVSNQYSVEVFGDFAYQLSEWFPQFTIQPCVKISEQQCLKKYDTVLHMYESELSKEVALWHPHSITLSHSPLYRADMTMTDIQVELCRQELKLENLQRGNGILPPRGLTPRKYSKRVVIHPTSSMHRKNWPAKKFLHLAKLLIQEGYSIDFMLSPKEYPEWLWVLDEGIHLPLCSSLSDTARWMYESAYFVGNDSGLGHLASSVGVPTVSIILRKGIAKQWRPSWAPARVILSPSWVNPRPIKEKLWKLFTKVSSVKKAFDELVRECHAYP